MKIFAAGLPGATFFVAVIMTNLTHAHAQNFNFTLKRQLDSIALADQHYRLLADDLTQESTDSLSNILLCPKDSVYSRLMALQNIADSSNLLFIEDIIKRHGYPGKRLVGQPTNEVAFYVIQHSFKIKQYLPLLQHAAKQGELQMPLVAMMEDRLLTEEEKEQEYGTQLWGNAVKDSTSGITKPEFYFHPIRDAENVNKRRFEAGFSTTIEQYAEEMHTQYRIRKPWWWKN